MGFILIGLGLIPGVRFIYLFSIGETKGHIQSLILSSILLIIGFQSLVIGLLADLIGSNRKLLEEVIGRVRRLELSSNQRGSNDK